MFKKLAVLAATVAGAGALAVGGAAVASAAPSALVSTTTNFGYTVGSAVLTTDFHNVTPGNGTVAELDLSAALHSAGVDSTHMAGDLANDITFLEITDHVSPSAITIGTGGDTLVKLNVVNSHNGHFGLAVNPGGSALQVPPFNVGGHAGDHGHASVTWERFVAPVNHAPYVYNGHTLTVSAHSATVGWSDSQFGWPAVTNGVLGNHCVMVFIYGFDKPAGQAHIGFTCDNGNPAGNVGYLRNLAAGHSVALFVQPAEGTYMNHHVIPGTSPKAHIEVVTPAV